MYLTFYAVTNLALFAALAALPQRLTISSWRGAAKEHPAITGVILVGLLSLVGTPPTAIFLGKLAAFVTTWGGGMAWLVVIAAAVSIASLFYALRWVVTAFQPLISPQPRVAVARLQMFTAVALGALILVAAVGIPAFLLQ
jgi:NADH-quinone oxidoreductase subunit N